MKRAITMPELSPKETMIFASFIKPCYPARVRSLEGLAKSTGLNPFEIEDILMRPKHRHYTVAGECEGRDVFHLRLDLFLQLNPSFHQHCLN